MSLRRIILEEIDEFDWIRDTEPVSTSLDDDELHNVYYVARKAELISQIISGNVYIKIENQEKQQDLERLFFDLGYTKFGGEQNVSQHHGLNNYWAKGDYIVVYNNGVTNKVIDVVRKGNMPNHKIRRGSDFSLSI